MTTPHDGSGRPWPQLTPAQRFGPLVLVVVLLLGAGMVATVKGGPTGKADSGPGGTTGGTGTKPGEDGDPWSSAGDLATIYSEADEAGTLADFYNHCTRWPKAAFASCRCGRWPTVWRC